MAKNRSRSRAHGEEKYRAALEGRKIPVLTLDNKWHKLFTQTQTTAKVDSLSAKLNELLKRQGRINSDLKEIKQLKKKLMDNIVTSMNASEQSGSSDKKMEETVRLIEECNEKLERYRDEALALPKEIDQMNYKLMLATMEVCYDRLQENTQEINEIGEWIVRTRIELKKQLLKKQEAEIANHELYSYMHDIFGSEVIEIFDMQYIPEEKKKGT